MRFLFHFLRISITFLPILSTELQLNPLYLFHIVSSNGKNCTAVVINEKTLLTVASCISEPITVYAASFEKHSIKYIKRHPEFRLSEVPGKFLMSDLAIIKLNSSIKEVYRAIPIENLGDVIFGNYLDDCEVAYWFSETDSIHKEIKRIVIKNLQIGRRDEAKIKISPYLDTEIENIGDKYLFSYGRSESDLKPLTHNSLPLICGGKLYGFFLDSLQYQEDIDILFWSRVSGYLDWIKEVIKEDNVKIIFDEDSYKENLPFALEANIVPIDYQKYVETTEETLGVLLEEFNENEELSDAQLYNLMKEINIGRTDMDYDWSGFQEDKTRESPDVHYKWPYFRAGRDRMLAGRELQTLRGQSRESLKRYIAGDPRQIHDHLPNVYRCLPSWMNPFQYIPWWLTPWGWAGFIYDMFPAFPWQILPTIPPGISEFTWPTWDQIFDALWYTTTPPTPCPVPTHLGFLSLTTGALFFLLGIILFALVLSSMAMLTF